MYIGLAEAIYSSEMHLLCHYAYTYFCCLTNSISIISCFIVTDTEATCATALAIECSLENRHEILHFIIQTHIIIILFFYLFIFPS